MDINTQIQQRLEVPKLKNDLSDEYDSQPEIPQKDTGALIFEHESEFNSELSFNKNNFDIWRF